MSTLTQTIIKVAEVDESKAKEIETFIQENFDDLNYSEATPRQINTAIKDAITLMEAFSKCKHPKGTQHGWECMA